VLGLGLGLGASESFIADCLQGGSFWIGCRLPAGDTGRKEMRLAVN